MAGFYSARASIMPPLPWPTFAPPLSEDKGDAILRSAAISDNRFTLAAALPDGATTATYGAGETIERSLMIALPFHWRDRVKVFRLDEGFRSHFPGARHAAAVRLGDGSWLIYEPSPGGLWRMVPNLLLTFAILILAMPLLLLAVWSGSMLVAPIAALAEGAARFSHDIKAPPVPEQDPREVRQAARALNAMRSRIDDLLGERTRALAAIGHDMRTPLTRLRLRCEAIRDTDLRLSIMSEVSHLQKMIDSALSYLRNQQVPTQRSKVDLAALAQTVVDDLQDLGRQAEYDGPRRCIIACNGDLIRRAVENLADNAVKHGGEALLRLRTGTGDLVHLDVMDRGPGISETQYERVVQPFHKSDDSRPSAEPSGFGLGLTIAKEIVESHGGRLALIANEPTGLIATLSLPTMIAPEASDQMVEANAHA